jgi:hypothetical protein
MKNFSFIQDPDVREALEWDYNIVEQNNLWDHFKKNDQENVYLFSSALSEYDWWGGHSGASYAISLRYIEHIAKYGWSSFVCKIQGKNYNPKKSFFN